MSNLTDNASIRRRAWSLTKEHFGVLFLMMLIVALVPSVASAVLLGLSGLVTSSSAGLGVVLTIVCSLALVLLTTALALGYQNAVLKLIRGNEISVGDVFSRMDCAFKGFLLTLFIGLRMWLWALPGMAVMVIGALFGESTIVFFSLVGAIVIYALMIPAAFRYCMAVPALADNPELGVLDAFNKSKEIMNGRKWTFFKLIFVIVLIIMLAAFALGLLTALLGQRLVLVVILSIASLLLSLAAGLVIEVATLIFYNQLIGGPSGDEASPEKEEANQSYQY